MIEEYIAKAGLTLQANFEEMSWTKNGIRHHLQDQEKNTRVCSVYATNAVVEALLQMTEIDDFRLPIDAAHLQNFMATSSLIPLEDRVSKEEYYCKKNKWWARPQPHVEKYLTDRLVKSGQGKAVRLKNITPCQEITRINQLKEALIKKGPLVAWVAYSPQWKLIKASGDSPEPITEGGHDIANGTMAHAVTLYGWRGKEEGSRYWYIGDARGAGWGSNGIALLSMDGGFRLGLGTNQVFFIEIL